MKIERLKRNYQRLTRYYFYLGENLERKKITLIYVIWNIFLFFLTLFSIFLVSIELTFDIPENLLQMYLLMDLIICIIFLTEFFIRFFLSRHKIFFFYTHFFDLLGSIPLTFFRYARLARLFLFFRFFRTMKKNQEIKKLMKKERSFFEVAMEAFLFIFLTTIFLILQFSFLILIFESNHVGANIQVPGDAFWWSWVTISTVGYGDYYPVTPYGKIAASFLILFGIGLFSSFTVLISSIFFSFADFKSRSGKEEVMEKKIDFLEKILKKVQKEQEKSLFILESISKKNIDRIEE